jgi:hypothetical protein
MDLVWGEIMMADTVSQIAFCKQNMATLKKMKFFSGEGSE